jgi:hypothetical protein
VVATLRRVRGVKAGRQSFRLSTANCEESTTRWK